MGPVGGMARRQKQSDVLLESQGDALLLKQSATLLLRHSEMSGLLRWMMLLLVGCSVFVGSQNLVVANEDGGEDAATHKQEGVPGMVPASKDLPLWSLVTFVLMMLVLGKFVWPTLNQQLLMREQKIRQDMADAEANRTKTETLVREHEAKMAKVQDEVREILAEARRDAEHAKQEIVSAAQREAESTKQRAIAEIGRSKDQALAELFEFVSNNVVGATERVIGRSLSDADHQRLVKEALAELGNRRN